MAKSTPTAETKRRTGKRELVENAAGDVFAKRNAGDQLKELDERG